MGTDPKCCWSVFTYRESRWNEVGGVGGEEVMHKPQGQKKSLDLSLSGMQRPGLFVCLFVSFDLDEF